jgi:hypothetical protein
MIRMRYLSVDAERGTDQPGVLAALLPDLQVVFAGLLPSHGFNCITLRQYCQYNNYYISGLQKNAKNERYALVDNGMEGK